MNYRDVMIVKRQYRLDSLSFRLTKAFNKIIRLTSSQKNLSIRKTNLAKKKERFKC